MSYDRDQKYVVREGEAPAAQDRQPKLLDQVRNAIRVRHMSIRTEEAYVGWIRRFILFHGKKHPSMMGAEEISSFLTHLAVNDQVSSSTQNQALSAILFLYKEVLEQEIDRIRDVVRPGKPRRVPVVLTRSEVNLVLSRMEGVHWLMAMLLYGGGLRQIECLRLRVKDLEFGRGEIIIRDAKGWKDRVTILPESASNALQSHLLRVKVQHDQDLQNGFGEVYLPNALSRKYPNAAREWAWQWVFPADRISRDPRSDRLRRHHAGERSLQRAVKEAVHRAGLPKK